MRIVTGGTFDLLHFGHVLHLRMCAGIVEGMENVVVMLVTDEWGRARKREPIISYKEREQMLNALGVKQVVPVGEPADLLRVVREVMPAYYAYEYATNSSAHDDVIAFCRQEGIGFFNIGKEPKNPYGSSTTSIIQKIKEGVPNAT